MQGIRCIIKWLMVWTIWTLGAIFLWSAWQFQKNLPDPTASYIEFAVMFVATFYFLALIPIKCLADGVFCSSRDLSEPAFDS